MVHKVYTTFHVTSTKLYDMSENYIYIHLHMKKSIKPTETLRKCYLLKDFSLGNNSKALEFGVLLQEVPKSMDK